jgi:C-terminal processing protease CtpA/Prc
MKGQRIGYVRVSTFDQNGSVAKIVKLEHAWRRLDGRNDDGFQVAPFPG